ncbi:MAG: hypothetical protein U0802_15235 [Candidatus Binatia bacterium]
MPRRSYEVDRRWRRRRVAEASRLAARGLRDVLLLEREAQPGYHASGRSAEVAVE